MSKTGEKILAGAREAVAIAKGEEMPARVTAFAWIWWHPVHGFDFGSLMQSQHEPLLDSGWKSVRVMIQTITNGDR